MKGLLSICSISLLFLSLICEKGNAIEFKVYGDVDYFQVLPRQPNLEPSTNGFALGEVDLFLSDVVHDPIDAETEMTVSNDGVHLERLSLRYLVNDGLKIRVGLVHSFVGFWDANYHHAAQLQNNISRPLFLRIEDEGGFLSMHQIGILLSGRFRLKPLALRYDFTLANAPVINFGGLGTTPTLDSFHTGDSTQKQVTFRVALSPNALPDLNLGFSGSFARIEGLDTTITPTPTVIMEVSQQLYAADLEYINRTLEFLSEYYTLQNQDNMGTAGSGRNQFYYLQLGVTLYDKFVPFARYERIMVDPNDIYMTTLNAPDLISGLFGLRYNLADNSSIKIEIQQVYPSAIESYTKYGVQWAFSL
jgi:hypothetical protein